MKKLLAILLVLIMALVLVPTVAFAEGEEGKVTITKTLESDVPDNDGNYTIKLTVQGNPVTQNVQPNADVVLVIDCSGSMDGGLFDTNRMKTAKNAGKKFADGILTDNSDNKMAVLGFSSGNYNNNNIGTGLVNNKNTIKNTIDKMYARGGTNYTTALTRAKNILDNREDKTRPGYVVFISDGAPGQQGESLSDPNWNGSEQVKQLKEDGVTIYTIGISLDDDNNQAAREYLKSMATSPSHFKNITDRNLETELETILTEWAAQINQKPAGINAVMVDVINDEFFDFVSADDGLTYDGDAKSLTWNIGDIPAEEQSITFKIKPKDGWTGTKDTNKSCKLNYTKHDGTPGEMEAPSPQLTIAAVVGTITVNKTVVMPEGDTTSVKDREYTFTIQGGSHTDSKKVVIGENNTGSVTFDNVPVGEYTVTESNANIDGYNVVATSDPDGGKVTVEKNQAATIAFTNTYTKTEEPKGALTISKTVTGLLNEILPASFTFEIKQGENTQMVTVNRKGNDNTYKSETVQLPYGTYTISEVNADVNGFNLNPTGLGEITIDKEHKEVTVNVTNAYEQLPPNTGTLTVKKTVSGGGADYNKEFTFTVKLEMNGDTPNNKITYGGVTFTNGVATFTLRHNQEKTITEIPEGMTYTVTENNDGYIVTKSGDTGTIEAGKTAIAAFNNYKAGGGGYYYPTTTPVPVIVIPPKTGDMTIWQSILHFLGIR